MKIQLILITLIFFSEDVFGRCGRPASHQYLVTNQNITEGKEGQELTYACDDSLEPFKQDYRTVYLEYRKCEQGVWQGNMSKCAGPIDVNISLIIITYLSGHSDSNVTEFYRSFGEIKFRTTSSMSIKIELEQANQPIGLINYDMVFNIDPLNLNLLNFDIHLNEYRNCFENPYNEIRDEDFEFVCEAKSLKDYQDESKQLPNSFVLNISSNTNFTVDLWGVSLFKFANLSTEPDCGSPDLPPFAASQTEDSRTFEIDVHPDEIKRYRKKVNGIYKISCSYEGNWDNQFSEFEPIVVCDLNGFRAHPGFNESLITEDFEIFDGSLVPVLNSIIIYNCNESIGSSNGSLNSVTAQCTEDGKWLNLITKTLVKDNPCQFSSIASESSALVYTLSGSLIVIIIIVLIIGFILWNKINEKRRTSSKEIEDYDDIEFDDKAGYEQVNYDYEYVAYKDRYEKVNYSELEANNAYIEIFADPISTSMDQSNSQSIKPEISETYPNNVCAKT